jgi:hypothetical protein
MSSFEAHKLFKDNSIDFLFIDGDHLYNGFYSDLENFWPKIKIGGIICGHDCEGKFSELPHLKDFIESNKDVDYTRDQQGYGYHCGVIKALYDFFNDEYIFHKNSIIWSKVKNYV